MAKLQELISSTTGIPAPPSEEVIQEIIQEDVKLSVRSTKINGKLVPFATKRSPLSLPGEDKLFRELLPSKLPSRAYTVLVRTVPGGPWLS